MMVELKHPEWWSKDKEGAIERAKEVGGMVIKSIPPDGSKTSSPTIMVGENYGYWVDEPDCMVRSWETVVYRSKE